jgi:hypothetical protein
MNKIDQFNVFVLCSDDVAGDMYHLHVKRILLVGLSYIVIEDLWLSIINSYIFLFSWMIMQIKYYVFEYCF